jgi:hypothetical protein
VIDPRTGKIIIVPPRQPVEGVLRSILVNEMVRGMKSRENRTLQRMALNTVKNYADEELNRLTE